MDGVGLGDLVPLLAAVPVDATFVVGLLLLLGDYFAYIIVFKRKLYSRQ